MILPTEDLLILGRTTTMKQFINRVMMHELLELPMDKVLSTTK